ncbi:uncharacterized protein Pyn_31722 [Prunus yedoensis var. nudiflora]|uniref:Uncharacterized protein n=1 Tax=Prunus yedoensis var. nudiflora TaxID=2094558 RepID=A0A314UC96_PRUYE|nr:uncharacterized protein Pyn_31722 [Prunus yedoensis var. nudiflora]
MNTLTSTSLCNHQISRFPFTVSNPRNISPFPSRVFFKLYANANTNELDTQAQAVEEPKQELEADPKETGKVSPALHLTRTSKGWWIVKLGSKNRLVVQKTAATFAPRASTASKNPAVPGSTLYNVFEVQAYASMLLGGVLSFNLIFPSNEPDIWRLMGMWSIWMFTIPSLRARDCSKNEKEALNYLFLLVPLLNVTIPFFWKSFAVVWSADTVAFFAMYAWKLGWLQRKN